MECEDMKMKLIGVVTVGPKGQIVIPSEIRKNLNIKPGDSISVITKGDKYVGLVRNEDMTDLMDYINNETK